MAMEFWVNPKIDLSKIKDSMQLDSGQTIATLGYGDYQISLEVRGDVKVFFDDVYYDSPSAFPDELKRLIETRTYWYNYPRVEVCENNWFEVFYGTGDNPYEHYDTVDAEGLDYISILELLLDCVKEMQHEK